MSGMDSRGRSERIHLPSIKQEPTGQKVVSSPLPLLPALDKFRNPDLGTSSTPRDGIFPQRKSSLLICWLRKGIQGCEQAVGRAQQYFLVKHTLYFKIASNHPFFAFIFWMLKHFYILVVQHNCWLLSKPYQYH